MSHPNYVKLWAWLGIGVVVVFTLAVLYPDPEQPHRPGASSPVLS